MARQIIPHQQDVQRWQPLVVLMLPEPGAPASSKRMLRLRRSAHLRLTLQDQLHDLGQFLFQPGMQDVSRNRERPCGTHLTGRRAKQGQEFCLHVHTHEAPGESIPAGASPLRAGEWLDRFPHHPDTTALPRPARQVDRPVQSSVVSPVLADCGRLVLLLLSLHIGAKEATEATRYLPSIQNLQPPDGVSYRIR